MKTTCPKCKTSHDVPTAQAIRAVTKYIKTWPPDIVPQAIAAKQTDITPQYITKLINTGKITPISVYGRNWVSISQIKRLRDPFGIPDKTTDPPPKNKTKQ